MSAPAVWPPVTDHARENLAVLIGNDRRQVAKLLDTVGDLVGLFF